MFRNTVLLLMTAILIWGCSSNDSDETYLVTLFDDSVEAGTYSILWDQTDSDDNLVGNGIYQLHLDTDLFNGMTYVRIGIGADSSKVVLKPNPPVPTQFAIRTDRTDYEIGDTIIIEIDIPTASDALVRVKRGGLPLAPIL